MFHTIRVAYAGSIVAGSRPLRNSNSFSAQINPRAKTQVQVRCSVFSRSLTFTFSSIFLLLFTLGELADYVLSSVDFTHGIYHGFLRLNKI